MKDKIIEILTDNIDTNGNGCVYGIGNATELLVQLMANKCAEAIHLKAVYADSYRRTMGWLGFTDEQAKIAISLIDVE